jgi:hypothetical protein
MPFEITNNKSKDPVHMIIEFLLLLKSPALTSLGMYLPSIIKFPNLANSVVILLYDYNKDMFYPNDARFMRISN